MADAAEREQPRVGVLGGTALVERLTRGGLRAARWSLDTPHDARPNAQPEPPRLIVLDASAERRSRAPAALEALHARWPMLDCVVWAPEASASLVRTAWQRGARDVLIDADEAALIACVERILDEQRILPAVERVAERRVARSRFEGMLSRSHAMWDLFETCERVAATDANVLVCGETGTGKELFARALHRRSGRAGRFVALNCSALPDSLVESELFGHEKGAFTGAAKARKGLFRHADGGTVFLDEIGDMNENAQQTLLRVLEERRVRPVGATEEVPVDVRVVAATHVPLEDAVAEGRFREDLFYRLDVIRFDVPPLRERPEDIVYLFGFFLKSLAKHYGVERPRCNDRFIDRLVAHDWPGNVRELENFAERVVLAGRRGPLDARDFARWVRSTGADTQREEIPRSDDAASAADAPTNSGAGSHVEGGAGGEAKGESKGEAIDLSRSLAEVVGEQTDRVERAYLIALMRATGGRMQVAAERAEVSRRTLLRKLRAHGIDRERFRG